MDEASIKNYILDTFSGVEIITVDGNNFYFYDPDPEGPGPHDRMFPFVTLMTNDVNDAFSNLSRPGIYRLNIGVSKATYQSLFGADAPQLADHDFTALDRIMPHPVYGSMYWVCVLNVGGQSMPKVEALLAEAYSTAVAKYDRKRTTGEA